MKREEAKKEFWQVSRDGYSGVFERAFGIKFNDVLKMPYNGSEFDKFIDKIYDDFESQIKEFETPKKCETCKHNDGDCAVLELLQDAFGFESDNCICPNYEPKEKK